MTDAAQAADKPFEVNAFQKAVAETYGHGDFSYVSGIADQSEFRKTLAECGDGLFEFLMVELGDKEDCDTADEARNRLENIRSRIDEAIAAIDALDAAPAPGR